MNKLTAAAFFMGMATFIGATTTAFAADKDCQALKDERNLIYAAKGFCFKDPEAKAKFGNENCNTTKPKFDDKEQKRLDEIQSRQKELNCK